MPKQELNEHLSEVAFSRFSFYPKHLVYNAVNRATYNYNTRAIFPPAKLVYSLTP